MRAAAPGGRQKLQDCGGRPSLAFRGHRRPRIFFRSVKIFMKLLVTDIDETLSRGESPSPEVKRACARLRDRGWSLMIATGRILATSMSHIGGIGSTLPAIVYNGARVMDPATGRAMLQTPMDPALALEIVEAAWDRPVEMQVIGDERAFCRRTDEMTKSFFVASGVPVDDSMECPSSPQEVFRVIFHGSPPSIRDLREELAERFYGRAKIVQAGDRFLDALPPGVSKGAALSAWLASVEKKPLIVAAAGDHHNDLELLACARIAAAPRDAADEVLEMAGVIMPPADMHGFSAFADWLIEWEKNPCQTTGPVVLS